MGAGPMKKLLLVVALTALAVGPANAADLGRPPPPPPPQIPAYIPFSWTGFYIGGNAGVAWGQKGVFTDSFGNSFDGVSQSTVFTGGGQVGANYQVNYWLVVGVEADFNWLTDHNNKSNGVFIPSVGNIQVAADSRWITTLAARVGVPVERALFYVKGGGAWVAANEFTVTNETTGGSFSSSNSNNVGGWMAGAGIEYAFAPNWTAKVEYDFLGLSNTSFTVPAGTFGFSSGDTFTTRNRDLQMLTVGFNYLFTGR